VLETKCTRQTGRSHGNIEKIAAKGPAYLENLLLKHKKITVGTRENARCKTHSIGN